ncbi:MAG: LamG-like jellyroll fold domain-containing protein [Caldilineaceae bacterium]
MNKIPALRIRQEHEIDLSRWMPDLSNGFTLEAWVCPAPMDRAARLYPQSGYAGPPVRLKAGLYKQLAADHLPRLGSACLPEKMEAVFFPEPNFQGETLASRHDLPQIADAQQQIGSLIVLDRSHRRQNFVVLFEQANYAGRAAVLLLPNRWQPSASAGGHAAQSGLQQVGSAWVPPGIALEVENGAGRLTLRGDLSQFPTGVTRIATRRDAPLAGSELHFTTTDNPTLEQKWSPQAVSDPLPAFRTVRMPEQSALFLFENPDFSGRHTMVADSCDDLSDLDWTVRAAAFATAPNGPAGLLALEGSVSVLAAGSKVGAATVCKRWLPPGFRLLVDNDAYLEYVESVPADNRALTVERYLGLLATELGSGLTIERTPGMLRGAGDELHFGGERLLPDRWVHLAQSWDSQSECLSFYLNGRLVRQSKQAKAMTVGPWLLGRGFRGTLAQVRIWNCVRSLEQIRDGRYPSTTAAPDPADLPTLDLFADGLENFQAPPAAAAVSAHLPQAPTASIVVRRIQQQLALEQQQSMLVAQHKAADQLALAHKRAQRTLALARQKARRDIHIQGIQKIGFVLGGAERIGGLASISEHYYPNNLRTTDLVFGLDDQWYVALDGGLWHIRNQKNATDAPDLPNPPQALTCDFSGNHAKSQRDGQTWIGLYWIEANGAICRAWIPPGASKHDERQQLFGFQVPVGRAGYWDLALDVERQILYWTNGWELYWSSVAADEPKTFQFLLPHVVSPFPVALAVAPNGSLLWVDAEEEVVRMLPQDRLANPRGAVKTLYSACQPARGLVVSRLADAQNSGKEAAFVYWVAKEQRTLEVPVLDTPGRYLDLYYDAQQPGMQHVEAVAVTAIIGAQWAEVRWVLPLEGMPFPVYDRYLPENADHDVTFGPFATEPGFVLTVQLRLDGQRLQQADDLVNRSSSWYNARYPHVLLTLVGFPGDPIQICDDSMRWGGLSIPYAANIPVDAWGTLRVECRFGVPQPLRVFYNESELTDYTQHSFTVGPEVGRERVSFDLPSNRIAWSAQITQAFGEVAAITVTALDDPSRILAQRTATAAAGAVTVGPAVAANKLLPAEAAVGEPSKLLLFSDATDVVEFEPVRLRCKAGWTVSAELIWESVSSPEPVCLYELATFEDEERLVCAIEVDATDNQVGLPILHVRWQGEVLNRARTIVSDRRLRLNQAQRVTWLLDGKGSIATFIDGEKVLEEVIDLPDETLVFEGHCLGMANTAQTHSEIACAVVVSSDAKRAFAGFVGRIIRFAAWNRAEPQAAVGWQQLPGPDPTWAHSLVTVTSERRYLHAGRLDGQEAPVTLFAIDLDGGLNLQSALDQAHAELTYAHAQMAAAEAHAAQLNVAAQQEAKAKLTAATQTLAAAQAQAAADLAAAQSQAERDKTDARRSMADADAKAVSTRATGTQQADQSRTEAQQTADALVADAGNKKRDTIARASRRLADKRQELADKQ